LILREALLSARERLRVAGSDEPEIEAEVLLRYALDLDRGSLLRLLVEPISSTEALAIEGALLRRFQGEPTAYITGRREFYGLDFTVTPAVLIPRPETEMLVEAVIQVASNAGDLTIVDVGTGSGGIAVSLATALPKAQVYATDLSFDALQVARKNAQRHAVAHRIAFRRGDLLEPLDTTLDVIVANLPYVTEPDWRQLSREIREHEPRLALASGDDGLDAIRALLRQAPRYLRPDGSIFLEFGIGQSEAIEALGREHFSQAEVEVVSDFGGIPRMLKIDARHI